MAAVVPCARRRMLDAVRGAGRSETPPSYPLKSTVSGLHTLSGTVGALSVPHPGTRIRTGATLPIRSFESTTRPSQKNTTGQRGQTMAILTSYTMECDECMEPLTDQR